MLIRADRWGTRGCGILYDFRQATAGPASRLLAALARPAPSMVSGGPRRFLHSSTKKGVLPGGGLEAR